MIVLLSDGRHHINQCTFECIEPPALIKWSIGVTEKAVKSLWFKLLYFNLLSQIFVGKILLLLLTKSKFCMLRFNSKCTQLRSVLRKFDKHGHRSVCGCVHCSISSHQFLHRLFSILASILNIVNSNDWIVKKGTINLK